MFEFLILNMFLFNLVYLLENINLVNIYMKLVNLYRILISLYRVLIFFLVMFLFIVFMVLRERERRIVGIIVDRGDIREVEFEFGYFILVFGL